MPAGPQTPSKRSLFMLSALSTATLSLVFVGSISAVQTNGLGGSPGALADSCGALAHRVLKVRGPAACPCFLLDSIRSNCLRCPFSARATICRIRFEPACTGDDCLMDGNGDPQPVFLRLLMEEPSGRLIDAALRGRAGLRVPIRLLTQFFDLTLLEGC